MAERARRRSSARRGVLLLAFFAAAAGAAEIRHLEIEKQDKRYRVTSETFIANRSEDSSIRSCKVSSSWVLSALRSSSRR